MDGVSGENDKRKRPMTGGKEDGKEG